MNPRAKLITPRAAALRLGISYDAVHRRLRRREVRALIRKRGGGLRGGGVAGGEASPGRGGFRGVWEIPDCPEVLEALRPGRRGRARK